MFKQIFFCLLLFPMMLFAETTAVLPTTPLPNADKLLATLVDGAIIPLYRELDVAAATFAQRSKTFCTEPTSNNFQTVRDGWGETMLAWQRTDPLLFGPAVEDQQDFHINFTPPKKVIINRLLTDTSPLTLEAVEQAGVGGQGLSTLEFLLFEREKNTAQMLETFQGETGKRRCAYVRAASELLQRDIHTITNAWLRTQNSYADEFRKAGNGSKSFSVARQPVDLLIGKLYQTAEKLAKQKIGNPLGKSLDPATEGKQVVHGEGNAYQLEAWHSGYSLKIAHANVEGMQRIMLDGGLLDWLRTQPDTAANAFVAQQMTLRMESYRKLPIADAFGLIQQGKGEELNAYYYLGNDLQMGIARQLAKVIGTPLGFNDSDGD